MHGLKAQNQTTTATAPIEQTRWNKFSFQNASIGLNLGTSSFPGLDVSYQFHPQWSARLLFGYAKWRDSDMRYNIFLNQNKTFVSEELLMDAQFNATNFALLAEYQAAWDGRLRIVGGLGVMPFKQFVANLSADKQIQFGDAYLSPTDFGSAKMTLNFANKIAPYLGIGLGRLRSERTWNFSADLGMYYLGNYKNSTLEIQPGLIAKANEDNIMTIQDNLNSSLFWKIYPVLNLRLGYALR